MPESRPGAPAIACSPLGIIAALVAVQILFGTHYVAAKEVVEIVPPRLWAAFRVTGASALLLALLALRRQPLPRGRSTLARFAGLAVLGVVVNQIFFVEGLSRTTPVNSALINSTIPVLTLLFAVAARHERATAARVGGITLGLAGIAVLLRLEAFDPGDTLIRGNLLTVVNAASFSAFLVSSRRTLQRVPTLPATCLLFLLGSIPTVALALPELGRFEPGAVDPRVWWLAAYIVVFPTVGAYLLNYWALRRAPSSFVALFIYLQPVVAAILSFLAGRGTPGPRDLLAFLLVAIGIAVAVRGSRRGNRPPA